MGAPMAGPVNGGEHLDPKLASGALPAAGRCPSGAIDFRGSCVTAMRPGSTVIVSRRSIFRARCDEDSRGEPWGLPCCPVAGLRSVLVARPCSRHPPARLSGAASSASSRPPAWASAVWERSLTPAPAQRSGRHSCLPGRRCRLAPDQMQTSTGCFRERVSAYLRNQKVIGADGKRIPRPAFNAGGASSGRRGPHCLVTVGACWLRRRRHQRGADAVQYRQASRVPWTPPCLAAPAGTSDAPGRGGAGLKDHPSLSDVCGVARPAPACRKPRERHGGAVTGLRETPIVRALSDGTESTVTRRSERRALGAFTVGGAMTTSRRDPVEGPHLTDDAQRSSWYREAWPVQTTVWAISRFLMQDRRQVQQALADDQRPDGGHSPGFHRARVGLWALALAASLPLSLVGIVIAQALGNDGSVLEVVELTWVGLTGAAMLWNSVRAATGGSPPL